VTEAERTSASRIATRGFVPANAAIVVGVALTGVGTEYGAHIAAAVIAFLPLVEGLLLFTNWRHNTGAFVADMRSRPGPPPLSGVPVFMWRGAGFLMLIFAVIQLSVALSRL